VLAGGTLAAGAISDVEVRDGRIEAIGEVDASAPRVDVSGRWIAPAFIDSHVHLALLPKGAQMAAGGVAAAVDLASPIEALTVDPAPLQLLRSGPMITAVGGYPTQSWGRDGYGLEVASVEDALSSVDELQRRGAGVIKLPLTGSSQLDESTLMAMTERAHELGLKVVVHALGDDEAALGARIGADVLAHTPVTALNEATVAAWSTKAVLSTLDAFGGSLAAVDTLRQLHGRGAQVLYGTDFGNSQNAGIQLSELALLQQAGLTPAEILASGTSSPAAYWGFDDLGRVELGASASLLILDADPLSDVSTLARPLTVYVAGVAQ
jgi:imidazolonepropionase-like amidohydrolase